MFNSATLPTLSNMSLLPSSSPAGRYYMPETPPPKPSGLECFSKELSELFIKERVPKSKKILTASCWADKKDWLKNPNSVSTDPDLAVRQK